MERPASRKEKTPQEEYLDLLGVYQSKVQELKKLQAKVPRGVVDEEILTSARVIDRERNEIHNQLKSLGEGLGKNDTDVMADILRKQGSLADHGLPEFFILDSTDMGSYGFNIGGDIKSEKDYFQGIEIDPQNVVIPFVISPQWIDSNWDGGYMAPKDSAIRERRARELAKTLNLEIVEDTDYRYFHDSSVQILGVVVPKSRIEEIARIIRDNPNKFRVGDEFYSDDDRKKIEITYQEMIKDDLGYRLEDGDEEYISEYWEKRKELYGEERLDKQKKSAESDPLLIKVNSLLEDFLGEGELERLPESVSGTEVLNDKKILMVDDDGEVFRTFIPALTVATGGSADFLVHGGQNVEDLVSEILKLEPEVVLLDKNLSVGIDGTNVAKELIKRGFAGTIVGFSSDLRAGLVFKDAGALGAITKNIKSPESSLRRLAEILR